MVKYYIYGGKGDKIFNSSSLVSARKKARKLSSMKSENYYSFISSKMINNLIETYYRGKKI